MRHLADHSLRHHALSDVFKPHLEKRPPHPSGKKVEKGPHSSPDPGIMSLPPLEETTILPYSIAIVRSCQENFLESFAPKAWCGCAAVRNGSPRRPLHCDIVQESPSRGVHFLAASRRPRSPWHELSDRTKTGVQVLAVLLMQIRILTFQFQAVTKRFPILIKTN